LSNKLNILFLCGWYPSRILPYNGDFIQRHAEAVNTLHNVTVIHLITDNNIQKNIEYTSNKINGVKTYINYIKKTKNPFLKKILFYKSFKKVLKEIENIDIVHLHELYPFGLFTFFIRKPLIITEHWTGYHEPQIKKTSFIQLFLSRLVTQRANFVSPVSLDLKKSMINAGLKGNYECVPNVVNTDLFFPQKNRKNKTFTILHVSNMFDSHKNVSGILGAFSKLDFDFKLQLLGKSSLKYKSLAKKLNIDDKVDFIEHVPHKKVVNYMQNADVFVLFSNYENLPCVILESFACGTPVISTDVGGVSEFFPKEYGTLIPKGDQDRLIEKVKWHKENMNSIPNEKMHQYVIKNFSNNSIAKQFNILYQKAIS